MAKAGDPRIQRAYRYTFRTRILRRDGFICYYCGGDADQVDHVIPISVAPELVVNAENAVACCKPCNTSKGNRPQGLFLAKTATPPVFSDLLSPKTSVMTQQGPCTGQPEQDKN